MNILKESLNKAQPLSRLWPSRGHEQAWVKAQIRTKLVFAPKSVQKLVLVPPLFLYVTFLSLVHFISYQNQTGHFDPQSDELCWITLLGAKHLLVENLQLTPLHKGNGKKNLSFCHKVITNSTKFKPLTTGITPTSNANLCHVTCYTHHLWEQLTLLQIVKHLSLGILSSYTNTRKSTSHYNIMITIR